jgi:hypothetical protein
MASLILSVPRLNAGEWMHFTFIESGSGLNIPRENIYKGDESFLNFPYFGPISHDLGRAKINYVFEDGCSR